MTKQNHEQKPRENLEQNTRKLRISRRTFLGTGIAAATTTLIILYRSLARLTTSKFPPPPPYRYTNFREPIEFTGKELRVAEHQLTLPGNDGSEGVPISVRLYNNSIPGPTLRRYPGEKIEFKFINNLPPNNQSGGNTCQELQHDNKPACFNTTNVHFHGFHVSPKTDSGVSADDVFVKVEPDGGEHQYRVDIPEFHAPGTHWYHGHHHGSTAIQTARGMAGAIIIPEDDKNKLGVTDDNDKIWLMQEIQDVSDGVGFYRADRNNIKTQFLINGEYQPTLTIDNAHTLQRWRFINATGTDRGLMTLKLYKCMDEGDIGFECENSELQDMYLIAVDGVSFYGHRPQKVGNSNYQPYQDGWELSPGNRADFLVSLPKGDYKLVKDRYETMNVRASNINRQVLAYIKVKGESDARGKIPDMIEGELPDYLQPISDREIKNSGEGSLNVPRKVSFSRASGGGLRHYYINGEPYDPESQDYILELNTAEQWVLSNPSESPHPFHIHVNHFQIKGDLIDPDKEDMPSNWRWWDTLAVNKKNVTIRHRFSDYDGKFVLHCHILIHEDQGMMRNVRIIRK
ncbi:MAG: multicopper oxidase family protein [Okeania sp. SIO3I5]|uniref:multicopper oxidase family protein n=1 Tax=Okeania sp. SIO3I5 TaxID=2607805 RepID=UPI0013B8B74B|nr:multicopper oxidase family protein [Okeania sp. SIO3I5]NEQ36494.1 multicopper oxidase family protein [Okeania sp. SIO3I5]